MSQNGQSKNHNCKVFEQKVQQSNSRHELKKIDNIKCFQNNVTLIVSENLSPFNQSLAWECREEPVKFTVPLAQKVL